MKKLQAFARRTTARLGHWLVARFDRAEARDCAGCDDPLVDVLHCAIGNRTGSMRVSDAYLICGLEAAKVTPEQMKRVGRAMRDLGWECSRYQLDGTPAYVYRKGISAERAVHLTVEYDQSFRTVRLVTASN